MNYPFKLLGYYCSYVPERYSLYYLQDLSLRDLSHLAAISFKCKLLCTNICTKCLLVRKLVYCTKHLRKTIDQPLPITKVIMDNSY